MIPTHFVDRMSKTLSGWLEGEGMSESLVEEARSHLARFEGGALTAALLTRLADRVEELEAAIREAAANIIAVEGSTNTPYPDDPRWSPWTRFLERALHRLGQALSPPMNELTGDGAGEALPSFDATKERTALGLSPPMDK